VLQDGPKFLRNNLLQRIDLQPAVERFAVGVVSERDLLAARAYQTGESAADATRRETVTAMETATPGLDGIGDRFQNQSICEGCGTLASDLAGFNGQMLCPECRDL